MRFTINFKLRLIGWIKRKFFQTIRFQPYRWTSIRREERAEASRIEIGTTFSSALPITILDPRSKIIRNFFYNERKFFNIEQAIIEPFQGLIWTATKRAELLKESTRWHPYVLQTSFPVKPFRTKIKKINEGVILTSTPYWHWLIEDLPLTIGILQKELKNLPIIVSTSRPKYVDDFIALTNNPYIETSGFTNVSKLHTADKGDNSGWPHPNDIKILKNYEPFAKYINSNSDRKIYISRKYSKRSPRNEQEVENTFLEFGFEVHYFEKLNLLEQISLSSTAKIIAGIHGAGLSNMIWMSEGGKIIDIYNENYWTESFHRSAHICKLDYIHFGYPGATKNDVNILELKKFLITIY